MGHKPSLVFSESPLSQVYAQSPAPALSVAALATPSVWTHSSGLKVVHYEQRSSPVVAVQVWVGVGAANEIEGEFGIAHVHEHMVFKGTDRRGVGKIASDIEAVGGSINAWTSLEETVYHVVMPSEHAALGVDVLLNGVTRPTIDEEELARELEVIREEIRRGDDVPARSHMEGLFAAAWGQHAYGRRVIGSIESVSAFDSASLRSFREKWYQLENMQLVVVGNCGADEIDAWVDAALDGDRGAGWTRPASEPAVHASNVQPIVEYRDVEIARVTVAFPGPNLLHEDVAPLEVLTTILAGTNSAVFYDRLVRGDGTALSAWCDGMYLRDGGLIFAGATFAPDAPVDQILRAMGEELSRLSARLRDEDIRRAIRAFESANLNGKTTVQGLATSFGNGAIHAGDPTWQQRWLEAARNVTVDDVRRVAKKWLRVEKAVIAVQLPLERKPEELRPSFLQDWLEEGFTARSVQPKEVSQPDQDGYQRFVLSNGIVLIVQIDRTLPIFSATIGTAFGSLYDSPEKAGCTALMAELLVSGNQKWDTAALEKELDLLGASLSPGAGDATTVMSVQGMTDEQFGTLEVARACWFTSVFPADEFENLRRVKLQRLRQSLESPGYIATMALRETYFPGHTYSLSGSGSLESLEALSRDDLVAAHQRIVDPKNIVVSVSGDIDLDALIAQLSSWESPLEEQSFDAPIIHNPAPVDSKRVDVEHPRKQAIVIVSYPGLERDHDDVAALSVLTSLMSGQGGRLFGTLREQRSLAYSVSMSSMSQEKAGILYAIMETSPLKIEEAVEGMREELARLIREPLSEEDVARARARIAGQMKVGLQRSSSRAFITLRDELLKRGYRYGLEFPQRVAEVNAQAIRDLAERLIRVDREIVVVARPKEEPAG